MSYKATVRYVVNLLMQALRETAGEPPSIILARAQQPCFSCKEGEDVRNENKLGFTLFYFLACRCFILTTLLSCRGLSVFQKPHTAGLTQTLNGITALYFLTGHF